MGTSDRLKNIGINSCGLDIGKRGGTQGRWLTRTNKNSQGLVLTRRQKFQ